MYYILEFFDLKKMATWFAKNLISEKSGLLHSILNQANLILFNSIY